MKPSKSSLIQQYLDTLHRLFPRFQPTMSNWRALRRLECKVSRANENLRNMPDYEAEHDSVIVNAHATLDKLGLDHPTIFLNTDLRGYAIKFDDKANQCSHLPLHRDWGGYVILAPTLH